MEQCKDSLNEKQYQLHIGRNEPVLELKRTIPQWRRMKKSVAVYNRNRDYKMASFYCIMGRRGTQQ